MFASSSLRSTLRPLLECSFLGYGLTVATNLLATEPMPDSNPPSGTLHEIQQNLFLITQTGCHTNTQSNTPCCCCWSRRHSRGPLPTHCGHSTTSRRWPHGKDHTNSGHTLICKSFPPWRTLFYLVWVGGWPLWEQR